MGYYWLGRINHPLGSEPETEARNQVTRVISRYRRYGKVRPGWRHRRPPDLVVPPSNIVSGDPLNDDLSTIFGP